MAGKYVLLRVDIWLWVGVTAFCLTLTLRCPLGLRVFFYFLLLNLPAVIKPFWEGTAAILNGF